MSQPIYKIGDIVITSELKLRKTKLVDFEAVNKILLSLIDELSSDTQSFLDKVAAAALELCSGQTAGVSLLKNIDGQEVLWRQSISGAHDAFKGTWIAKHDGPCGMVLDTGKVQLFRDPKLFFEKFQPLDPPVIECMILPLRSSGKNFGTFWVMKHNPSEQFNAEDARMLEILSNYVSTFLHKNETQNLLRESEERFRATVDYASVGVCVFDLDGKIQQANPAFCEIVEHTNDELIQQDIFSITHPDDRAKKHDEIKRMLEGEIPAFRAEKRYVCKSGKDVWVQNSISLIRDVEGEPINIVAVVTDITDEKKLQDDLSKAKNQAEIANIAKSRFLANMSHEIRTPLTAILGFANLLKDTKLRSTTRGEYLDIICRSGNSLSQLIDDILDLSKIEMGYFEIENTEFSLANLIHESISLLQIKAQQKGITLTMDQTLTVPKHIFSDSKRLRQILINMVGNAVKFTEKGSVHVNVDYVNEKDGKGFLTIKVRDSGLGLTGEQKDRLFKPFSQADNTMARKYGGTGLGLELSRRMSRALGGDVELLDSVIGEGSTFLIKIKTSPVQQKVAHAPTASSTTPSDLTGIRVLLVDDSIDNQLLIKFLLQKCGAQVDVANNGEAGVEKALKQNFDIVLMDIQMPLLDGYQATEQLRHSGFNKPIIALTAHAMTEDRDRCMAAGCTYYLTKPLNPLELSQTIRFHVH